MQTLDRYLVRQFLVNFVILLFVLTSLFVLIDVVVNLDEYLDAGWRVALREAGVDELEIEQRLETPEEADQVSTLAFVRATMWVVWDWHAPTSLLLYVYQSGLVIVAAMGFTFAELIRKRELVAILTSGVSIYRTAAPVMVAGGLLNFLALPVQEFLIPREAENLVRSHQHLGESGMRHFEVRFAPDGEGSLFSAAQFDPEHGMLKQVLIVVRDEEGIAREVIVAEQAWWSEKQQRWELVQGHRQRPNVSGAAPAAPGLPGAPETVEFVESRLTPQVLIARRAELYPTFLSIGELLQLRENEAIDVLRVNRIIWQRFSFVFVNVIMMLMGAPFFLSREPGNQLIQAVRAALVCGGCWVSSIVVIQLGTGRLDAFVSAWLPVVINLPLGLWLMQRIKT